LTFKLKINTPVIPVLKNIHADFGFCMHFVFELGTSTGQTDGRSNGRTKARIAAYSGSRSAVSKPIKNAIKKIKRVKDNASRYRHN